MPRPHRRAPRAPKICTVIRLQVHCAIGARFWRTNGRRRAAIARVLRQDRYPAIHDQAHPTSRRSYSRRQHEGEVSALLTGVAADAIGMQFDDLCRFLVVHHHLRAHRLW